MAPLPASLLSLLPRSLHTTADIPDLRISSLELDDGPFISPLTLHDLHRRQDAAPKPNYGGGAPANAFNNKGFLALFAVIGAGMVISSIWFFFWARNGGFKWRKGDWDDYKSTVLRRKGPDGKTLSNATKSTKLGGGSIVAGQSEAYTDEATSSYTDDVREMREVRGGGRHGGYRDQERDRRERRGPDPELREYRHEKPARVGGLNREADGSHFDYSNTDRSEANSGVSQQQLLNKGGHDKKREKKERERREKESKAARKQEAKDAAAAAKKGKEKEKAKQKGKQTDKKRSSSKPSSRTPSPTKPTPTREPRPYHFSSTHDDTYTDYTAPTQSDHTHPSDSYYAAYRPRHASTSQPDVRPASSHRHNGTPSRSRQSSPRKASRHNAYEQYSDVQSNSDTGTKVYPCHIPGLSKGDGIAPGDSVSQVGARSGGGYAAREGGRKSRGRDVMDGYRRAGRRRRDSLSDSGEE